MAERLHLLPKLRQRVLTVPLELGRPLWVEDPDFDLANHVRVDVLDAPGDRAALEALADRSNMELLDRRRPLWELRFVIGLDDGNVAMIEKVHHAMVDGVAGVDLASILLDAERDVAAVPPPTWCPAPLPDVATVVSEGLREGIRQPLDAVRW
ncbi:wax ester/triacylglycerol synthase domain-containing protein, partial [Ralstonia solanacearum species complex bacterium RW470]|uniref:wax ester/triacylglycerol synthase domain-containing protein n=1 Tax=Ralstonia solanacearum species complex bacterium RW470 TaxID=3119580 RepID=UPI002FC33B1E